MSSGRHDIQLASVANGTESPRSSPLAVIVETSGQNASLSVLGTDSDMVASGKAFACAAGAGGCYDVLVVADDLKDATSLTPLPDGRLFFIEDWKSVRVLEDTTLLPDPSLDFTTDPGRHIVGLAADGDFARTRTMFVAWTEDGPRGTTHLNVTRYRELANAMGEGAQIVTGLPIRGPALVPMGVDANGHLYVALLGNEDPARAPLDGEVLRFDRDGLTPASNPRSSPVLANGFTEPTSLAIDGPNGRVWLAGLSDGRLSLASFSIDDTRVWPLPVSIADDSALPRVDQAQTAALALSGGTQPSMLMAAGAGLWLSKVSGGQVVGLEPIPVDQGTPTAVARSSSGSWYVATRVVGGSSRIVLLKPR